MEQEDLSFRYEHPAAGLGVAMATELCAVLPQGGLSVGIGGT